MKVVGDFQAVNRIDNVCCIKISDTTKISVTHLVAQRLISVSKRRPLIITPEILSLTKERMGINHMLCLESGNLRSMSNLVNCITMLLAKAREQLQRQLHEVTLYR